ncbi:YjeF N-terminal domain-containing protein [Mycena capillaripes]|nr:YjeF N-terminal domain-containing protein [Mycena capillaripes]
MSTRNDITSTSPGHLSARLSQQIDDELMSAAGAFSLDQLMELAGLACAQTVVKVYVSDKYSRVLVCCGGDGLVAARHLCKWSFISRSNSIFHDSNLPTAMFGYKPTIYMPKPGSKDIYQRLHTQCKNMSIPTLPEDAESLQTTLKSSDVIFDAIFGFSFEGPIRAPFDAALPMLSASGLSIVLFRGQHFLGGRFVPRSLEEKSKLNLPAYPGYEQIVEITEAAQKL